MHLDSAWLVGAKAGKERGPLVSASKGGLSSAVSSSVGTP